MNTEFKAKFTLPNAFSTVLALPLDKKETIAFIQTKYVNTLYLINLFQ